MSQRPFPESNHPGQDSSPHFEADSFTTNHDSHDGAGDSPPSSPSESSSSSSFGAGIDASSGSAATVERKRKRRGRKKRGRGSASSAGAKEAAPVAEKASADKEGGAAAPRKKRRSRKRKPNARQNAQDGDGEAASPLREAPVSEAADRSGAASEDGSATKSGKKRRRRGTRGGRKRKAASSAGEVDSIPGEEDDLPELPPETESLSRGKKRGKKARGSSRKKATKTTAATSATKKTAELPSQLILVNAIDYEEKRVVVVEDSRIVDVLMTVESQKSLVGDIYRGKVVNLEPAIGAAFVDFGQGRNGFLHTSDVLSVYGEDGFTLDRLLTAKVDPGDLEDAESQADAAEVDSVDDDGSRSSSSSRRRPRKRLPISDLLNVGDYVVVQVTKDAIGDKGPTLTTYISIPGRYLVLMPSMTRTGVSRKIEDEKERRRLKRILQALDVPVGMGVIVRTAGVGTNKTDVKRDLEYLMGVWETFGKRL
jgi:hypothetical protein